MVISPSHSLIILFPSHSGNLMISLSDGVFPSHSGNLTISEWDGEIPCHTVVISPSHSLIILLPLRTVGISPSHSEMVSLTTVTQGITMIREWDGEIPFAQWNLTMIREWSWWDYHCRAGNNHDHSSDHLEITTVRSGNLTMIRSLIILDSLRTVESHHQTLRSSDSLHTVVISPSQSEMVRLPLCTGNKMISEWDGEITTVAQWNLTMIREWDGDSLSRQW